MNGSILLFGATSILGFNLAGMFPETVLPFITRANRARSIRRWPVLNLEDPAWPDAVFKQYQPDISLHCRAVCDLPRCEAAPNWAREVNIEYVRRVMAALPEKTTLVYVSSDHVFGGDGVYDEDSSPCVLDGPGTIDLKVGSGAAP
jgi:dTDP-4-dehydrorhamnose reductase